MKRIVLALLLGGLAFMVLSDSSLMAQSAAENGGFATGDLDRWENEDSSVAVLTGSPAHGMYNYCCKKNPGAPNDNGAIEQEVHLIGGVTYIFSADIAAKYCSS